MAQMKFLSGFIRRAVTATVAFLLAEGGGTPTQANAPFRYELEWVRKPFRGHQRFVVP